MPLAVLDVLKPVFSRLVNYGNESGFPQKLNAIYNKFLHLVDPEKDGFYLTAAQVQEEARKHCNNFHLPEEATAVIMKLARTIKQNPRSPLKDQTVSCQINFPEFMCVVEHIFNVPDVCDMVVASVVLKIGTSGGFDEFKTRAMGTYMNCAFVSLVTNLLANVAVSPRRSMNAATYFMLAKFVDEGPTVPGLKDELHMGMTVELGLVLLNAYLVAILYQYHDGDLQIMNYLFRR
jgi:hypothetical protein